MQLSERLNIAITEKLLAGLRQAAEASETNVSEFVRQTLRQRLAAERKREATDAPR
jgi:metal-responsive CopG/Arc/MetJ family transcriptional regulator